MKYIVRYILPLAAIGFLACSGEEVNDNPGYDPINHTVNTELAISIGHAGDKTRTRMTDAITQNDGSFRGIKRFQIYSTVYSTGNNLDNLEWSTAAKGKGLLPSSDDLNETETTKVITGLMMPIFVNRILFYGFADDVTAEDASIDDKMQKGYTKAVLPDQIDNDERVEFKAVQIAPNYENDVEWKTPVQFLESYLTSIARTDGWSEATNLNLIEFYQTFTKDDRLFAGSAVKVLATVQELYKVVYEVASGSASDDQKTIANAIIGYILNNDYVTSSGEGASLTLDWVSSFKNKYANFPENLGLPQGAAQYEFKNAPDWKFVYNTENTVNTENTDVKDYIYPCELCYMTYSPLRAFDEVVEEWPQTPEEWSYQSWAGWESSIASSTLSVALVNNVQYGMAQLATYIKCSPATLNSNPVLYDNKIAVVPEAEENGYIQYSDDIFQLTGVIVGGQPNKVGWNFLPASDDPFRYAVYDRDVPQDIYANEENGKGSQDPDYEDGFCGPNRTLVFDNGASGSELAIVNVCLEFLNKGDDFYGRDGLIKHGQKFYLVGKLDPQKNTETLSFNEPAVYYPSNEKRVFIQDRITKARFTINAGEANVAGSGSLAKAYSTIPDLRMTNQELGLSVNLQWEDGLTFKDHPLGNK